ncbi:MAG: Planctomycete cytochrome [Chthoniobacteraceae bacterium]|nr:Planctomycete cytochrome [Chthoniobacteraceae bacterium]
MTRFLPITLLLTVTTAVAGIPPTSTEPTAEGISFFEKKIRPILSENCYRCHSVEKGKAKGDLTLDTRDALLKGGKNGAVLVPGDPEKSALITAVSYSDPDLQMPPKGEKLTESQITDLMAWIKMGAPDPRKAAAGSGKLSGLTDKAREHWAYQPVRQQPVPVNHNQQWCRTPVDAFILQKLEAKNMVPAPDAGKEALLRRATYDLIGLPPSPQEVEAFLTDTTPGAFAKVIDRLLASPHYGERWGRFWLDTARYSDTAGGPKNAVQAQDYRFPYAWTYRDYVIKAFNEDKPYDQFIVEQLAADKLPETKDDQTKLAALGFLTVGERFKNPNDIINDRIDVVCKGFLGMTVTCARCHDHMFDPIPTKDYYALHGIFNSTIEPAAKPLINAPAQAQLADFESKLASLEKESHTNYYNFLERTLGSFHGKVGSYLMVTRNGGKKRAVPPSKSRSATNSCRPPTLIAICFSSLSAPAGRATRSLVPSASSRH